MPNPLNKLASGIGAGVGVGLGVGAALAAATALHGDMRPLLRGAVKGGIAVGDAGQRLAVHLREGAEDIYHEARQERAVERDARDVSRQDSSRRTVYLPRS